MSDSVDEGTLGYLLYRRSISETKAVASVLSRIHAACACKHTGRLQIRESWPEFAAMEYAEISRRYWWAATQVVCSHRHTGLLAVLYVNNLLCDAYYMPFSADTVCTYWSQNIILFTDWANHVSYYGGGHFLAQPNSHSALQNEKQLICRQKSNQRGG